MSNEIFANAFAQSQSLLAPVVKANKLAVANLEKLVAFQMSALNSYVNLGVSQLKAAAAVSSPKEVQDFLNSQLEVAGIVRQKLADDAKTLADLSAGFKAGFEKLAQENVAELSPKAVKPVPRKAA